MTKLGSRMTLSAQEAAAYAAGDVAEGFVVHNPVDVMALRAKLGLSQPETAARYGLSAGTTEDLEDS